MSIFSARPATSAIYLHSSFFMAGKSALRWHYYKMTQDLSPILPGSRSFRLCRRSRAAERRRRARGTGLQGRNRPIGRPSRRSDAGLAARDEGTASIGPLRCRTRQDGAAALVVFGCDPAPLLSSIISRGRSGCGPGWTGSYSDSGDTPPIAFWHRWGGRIEANPCVTNLEHSFGIG